MRRASLLSPICCLVWLSLIIPVKGFTQLYAQKIFTVTDGLPGSFTYRAYQDREGYLWIATTAGLSRFDGKQFVNYGLSDGLRSLKADGLLEDSRGRFWVGTNAGMAEFRDNRFVYYPLTDSATIYGVADFEELRDGTILASTTAGAYLLRDSVWRPANLSPAFDHLRCRDVVQSDDGLYARFDSVVAYRSPAGQWERIALPRGNRSISNRISRQGNAIIASIDAHLYQLSGRTAIPIDTQNNPGKNYFSYTTDARGRLWAGGADFLKVSLPGNWSRFVDSVAGARNIYYLCADSAFNLWGATSDGLLRIREMGAVAFSGKSNPALSGITDAVPLSGGRLVTSDGGRLSVFDQDKSTPIALPPHCGDMLNITAGLAASDFLLITRNGLFEWKGSAFHPLSRQNFPGIINDVFDACYSRSRGGIWVCTDSSLLFQNASGLLPFIPHHSSKAVQRPLRVWETQNGLVLVYLDGLGVFGITAQDDLVSLIRETGIDGSHKGRNQHDVYFYEDGSLNFWIAFPGMGLFEYGFQADHMPYLKRQFTSATDGLQSDKIISLTADNKDRLWVESDAGIDILQKDESGDMTVYNFAGEGDLNLRLNGFGKLVSIPAENQVWLYGPGGVIRFDPSALRLAKQPPHVIIERVSLDFKQTNWHDRGDSVMSYFEIPVNPALPFGQNSLSIFFNAVDLATSSPDPEWAYRLLPLDTVWSLPARVHSVSFARLPRGNYVFEVRARDHASGWGAPARLTFSVTPPFWNTWWFVVLCALLGCALIGFVIRAREKRIHQRAFVAGQLKDLEMKALKAQIKPHFIYNALNSIQALVVSGKKEESLRYIGSFSRLLRQVLEYTESNTISLDKELETLGLYVQVETLRLGMELHFREELAEDLVSEFEKVPPLILQPFVENAIWHGLSRKDGIKEIILIAKISGDWLICEVRDNGVGRAAATDWKAHSLPVHRSLALDITRKRLLDFNGSPKIDPIVFIDHLDSEQRPLGTSVILTISRKSPMGY